MVNLGRMYEKGTGVGQDMNKAISLFRQSAEKGNESGKKALARVEASQKTSGSKASTAPKNKKRVTAQKPKENPDPLNGSITNAYVHDRPRMFVLPFEDRSEGGQAPAKAIINTMITELHKSGVFNLVERERTDVISQEISLGQSGLVDPSTAAKVGKLMGAQYVMIGAITLYYYSEKGSGFPFPILGFATKDKTAYVVIDIRIVNVSTGLIVYTDSQTGEASQKNKTAPGSYSKMTEGLLGMAVRNSVKKHVSAIRAFSWQN